VCFPSFLEHRRRAEAALASVVATSCLLGVSTRRVEKLAAALGVTSLSRSQVSVMAAELDEMAESFRSRPLDVGPYTFAWIDALTQKVREGGRTISVHCLIATGVNADGHRTNGPNRAATWDRKYSPPAAKPTRKKTIPWCRTILAGQD
jgi:transposase-like protein